MKKPIDPDEVPVEQPEEPVNEWEVKAAEYLAGWKRAQADLENYRKRSDEEKQSFMKFAHSDVLLQILPVLDNFKRAAEHVPDETNLRNWVTGIKAIEKQFEQIMNNNGVTQIPVTIGAPFDPTMHEALMSEESEQEPDTITGEIEPGYMLHGRVLRAAKVKVAK